MKYRILGALAGFIVIPAIAWLSGYNFNERGETAVMVFTLTPIFTFWGGIIGSILNLGETSADNAQSVSSTTKQVQETPSKATASKKP